MEVGSREQQRDTERCRRACITLKALAYSGLVCASPFARLEARSSKLFDSVSVGGEGGGRGTFVLYLWGCFASCDVTEAWSSFCLCETHCVLFFIDYLKKARV